MSEKDSSELQDNKLDDASAEEQLTRSLSCKDYANQKLGEGDFIAARDKYMEGLSIIKDLTTPGRRDLDLALNLNLSMTHIKLEEWPEAIDIATKALDIESKNLKALYRRGVARSNYGYLSDAKEDFLKLLQIDPTNGGAQRELILLKQKIQKHQEVEKNSYKGLFGKATLYEDRALEEEERKAREAAEQKKLRTEWESHNKKRQKDGKDIETFDDWKKEKDRIQAEQRKKSPKRNDSPSKDLKSKAPSKVSLDTIDLDEEDHKIIEETKKMGYCYFSKPKSGDDSNLNLPVKIENSVESSEKTWSAWNTAGTTWEEKDMTSWCMDALKKRLNSCKVEALEVKIFVKSVNGLDGEAHIAVVRNTPRYIFDFHCNLSLTVTHTKEYDAKVEMPDISSSDHETEIRFLWESVIPQELKIKLENEVINFKDEIRKQVLCFVKDYQSSQNK
eukprot:GHVL01013177.1.p1 GENE.GHVL01013177.1~~GHVL01013177.1.p1  ORF type:complete len:447 (+),score=89.00 GHVL01013177.1:26-1366(+)